MRTKRTTVAVLCSVAWLLLAAVGLLLPWGSGAGRTGSYLEIREAALASEVLAGSDFSELTQRYLAAGPLVVLVGGLFLLAAVAGSRTGSVGAATLQFAVAGLVTAFLIVLVIGSGLSTAELLVAVALGVPLVIGFVGLGLAVRRRWHRACVVVLAVVLLGSEVLHLYAVTDFFPTPTGVTAAAGAWVYAVGLVVGGVGMVVQATDPPRRVSHRGRDSRLLSEEYRSRQAPSDPHSGGATLG